jgi:lysophospholipase L1-like esterase
MPMMRGRSAGTAALLATAALMVVCIAASCASDGGAGRGAAGRSASPGRAAARLPAAAPGTARRAAPLRTSCRAVTHFGDSTSDGLVSADYLPDPAQRINAQYARVGATVQHFEIQGATSVAETVNGEPDAYDVARQLVRDGYRGCWVLALGTNDTADVAVGSYIGQAERIKRMMSVTDGEPVLWVNVRTLVTSGPYSQANMRAWNDALVRACASYPNMRIFDWASVAQPRWFISDGTHYTSAGYAERARLIATALAEAFPRDEPRSSGCVVRGISG